MPLYELIVTAKMGESAGVGSLLKAMSALILEEGGKSFTTMCLTQLKVSSDHIKTWEIEFCKRT